MTKVNIKELNKYAESYIKLAQTTSTDTDLTDAIKQAYGKGILDLATQALNNYAVSSIPISINYSKPNAAFIVSSTGTDSSKVDQVLKEALDKKFGSGISNLISKKDPNTNSFKFVLMTVESNE